MKNPDKIALFDMDQTLCDYMGQLNKDLEALRSPEEPKIDVFDGSEWPDYIEARIKLIKSQTGWWRNLTFLELGYEIFSISDCMGFNNQILTKGPRTTTSAWTEKVQWVHEVLEYDFQPKEYPIHISEDKGLVYGRVLCDDYPVYMDRWLENRPRGLGIMIENKYNKDYKHPNVVKATENNLDEVKERLQEAFDR
jgi:hypothetical protein